MESNNRSLLTVPKKETLANVWWKTKRCVFGGSHRPYRNVAELDGNLWEYNVAKVVVVDVSDDYRLMQKPMPSEFYPVVAEHWVPAYSVKQQIVEGRLIEGYAYDWHEGPVHEQEPWYIGVVREGVVPKA